MCSCGKVGEAWFGHERVNLTTVRLTSAAMLMPGVAHTRDIAGSAYAVQTAASWYSKDRVRHLETPVKTRGKEGERQERPMWRPQCMYNSSGLFSNKMRATTVHVAYLMMNSLRYDLCVQQQGFGGKHSDSGMCGKDTI